MLTNILLVLVLLGQEPPKIHHINNFVNSKEIIVKPGDYVYITYPKGGSTSFDLLPRQCKWYFLKDKTVIVAKIIEDNNVWIYDKNRSSPIGKLFIRLEYKECKQQ